MQRDFRLAVVALHVVDAGQRAAVELEIQFAVEDRIALALLVQPVHERRDRLRTLLRQAGQIDRALHVLEHSVGRAAAAVAEAVGHKAAVRGGLVNDLIDRRRHRLRIGDGLHGVEVGQHLAAVQTAPAERVGGHLVHVVPADLGGQEVFHVRFAHDLRNGGVVAERVGQPEAVGGVAEAAAGVALTVDKLARHGLAAGDVAVALDPYAAVRLIASLGHALFNALEDLRIVFFHPVCVQRGGLDEIIILIALHQVERFGIGARALADGLRIRPQPRRVHVRMADQAHVAARAVIGRALFQRGRDQGADFLGRRVQLAARMVDGGLYKVREGGLQRADRPAADKVIAVKLGQLNDRAQVEHHAVDRLVHDAHVDAAEGEAIVLLVRRVHAVVVIGGAAGAEVTGVAFEIDMPRFRRIAFADVHRRVHTADEIVLGVNDARRRAVAEAEDLGRAGVGDEPDLLAERVPVRRHIEREPDVLPQPAPLIALMDGGEIVDRRPAQVLLRPEGERVGNVPDRRKDIAGVNVQRLFVLGEELLRVNLVIHGVIPPCAHACPCVAAFIIHARRKSVKRNVMLLSHSGVLS